MVDQTYLTASNLKVAVVGTGAVGGLLAACLANAGNQVSVADENPELLGAMRKYGLRIHGKLDLLAKLAGVYQGLDILQHGPYDLVVLVLKVPVLASLSSEIAKADNPKTNYLVACNGVGSENALIENLGPKRVHRAVLNLAAGIEEPGVVHLVSLMGDSLVGPCYPARFDVSEEIAKQLSKGQLVTHAVEDIQSRVWQKTILNASLSALCSVTNLTMKAVLSHEDGHEIMLRTLREAIEVAKAKGIELPNGFFEDSVAYLKRGGDHYPSMHSDLVNGHEIEIEYINAPIVATGEQCGVPTPYNRALTSLVRLLRDHR
ncbi:MAG: 2-dehydropantoate 2-reductase [Pseudomonadota bacterium]